MSFLCYIASWYAFLNRSYSSFKILKHGNELTNKERAFKVREGVQFWIIFALISIFDLYLEFLISWFPLYWYVKLGLLVWIANPHSNGAIVTFERFVQPRMKPHVRWIEEHTLPIINRFLAIIGSITARLLLIQPDTTSLESLSSEELESLAQMTRVALIRRGSSNMSTTSNPPPPPPMMIRIQNHSSTSSSITDDFTSSDDYVHVPRTGSVGSMTSNSGGSSGGGGSGDNSSVPPLPSSSNSSISPRSTLSNSLPQAPTMNQQLLLSGSTFEHPMYYPTRNIYSSPSNTLAPLVGVDDITPEHVNTTRGGGTNTTSKKKKGIVTTPTSSNTSNKKITKTPRSIPSTPNMQHQNTEQQPTNPSVFDEDYHQHNTVTPTTTTASYNLAFNSSADEVLELYDDSPIKSDRKTPTVPSRDREPLVSPVFTSTRRLSWLSPRWPFFQDAVAALQATTANTTNPNVFNQFQQQQQQQVTTEQDNLTTTDIPDNNNTPLIATIDGEPLTTNTTTTINSNGTVQPFNNNTENNTWTSTFTTSYFTTTAKRVFADMTSTENNMQVVNDDVTTTTTTTNNSRTNKRDGPVTRAMARRAAKKR
jgi:hypothetical protein